MNFFDQYLDEKHSGKQKNTKPKTNSLKKTFSPILNTGKSVVNTVKNEAKKQITSATNLISKGIEEGAKKYENERKIQSFRDSGGFAKNPKAETPIWKNENIVEKALGTNSLKDVQNNFLSKYNTADSASRILEVERNLENGLKNDPRAKRALKNNDLKDFRSMYGYDTADKTKKMLIDTVWAKNGGKSEWEITAGNRDTKNDPKILSHEIIRREKNGEIDTPLLNKFRNAWSGYEAGKTAHSVIHKPQYKEANGILDVGTHWHNLMEEGKMTGSAVLGAGLEGLDVLNRATLGTIFASGKNTAIKEYEDAEYNAKRNNKIHEIRTTDWGQNEEQDTGIWGVVKQFGRMAGGNMNRALAGVANHMGNKDLANFFDDNADTYLVSQMRNNSENPDTFVEKILMGGLNLVGSIVYGTAGAAVGGGKGALAGASMFGASQEYGSMKNEILLATGDNAKASEYGRIYATGAGLLEGIFPASKVTALGGGTNGIISGTYKEAFLSVLKDMAKEGTTEASQEMLGNVFKYQEGLVKNYFEGVGESALLGAILGGGVGVATNAEVRQAYTQLKNDIPKALDIITKPSTEVNETIDRIARVAIQEYENVAKNTEISMSDNSGRVEVSSVRYDEGKYRASARIETENNNTTIGFDEVFATKEEAVKNAMVRASDVLPAESDIKYEIDTRLDDIYREHEIGREKEFENDKINWENVDIEGTVAKLENEAKKSAKVDGYNSKNESVGISGAEHKDEGYTVYKGITKGAEKKFPLDYFAFDKNTAKQYGDTVIEKKIFPKKIADFTDANSQEKLSKIILDEYTKQYPNIEKEYFEKQIQKGFENTDSFMNPIYEMIENEGVTKKLKEEGYDSAIYWDWGKGGRKRHKTIAMFEVEDILQKNPKIAEKKENIEKTNKNPPLGANDFKQNKNSTGGIGFLSNGVDINSISENVYKSNKNPLGAKDASPTDIEDIISENILKANDFLQFSSNSIFFIKNNGEKIEYKKPDTKRQKDWNNDRFQTNEKLPLSKNEEKFLQTLKDVQLGKIQEGIIGNGKYGKIRINTETTDKIFQKHGPFYLENLIATANNWDFVVENRGGTDGKINLIKQFSNNKGVILAGNIDADGVFSVTFYEPRNNIKTLVEKEIQKGGQVYTKDGKEIVMKTPNNNASYNSTSSDGVSKAENRSGDKAVAFKLSNRIREVIEKMGTQFTRYTNVGATGTFYTKSGNIAINSVNDIDVVHHELSHQIDIQNSVTDAYKNDSEIKQMLYDIYTNEYAGAIPDASEDLYMREGYAVLQEKHLMKPTETEEKYPKLVEIFVENGHELQKMLNEEMGKIIADYQGLTDIEKIGAILTNGKTNKKFEDFLSVAEKVEMNVADAVLPFVKMEEQIEEKTELANTLYARNVIYGRIAANIDPNNMKWMASAKESGKEMKLKRVDQTDFWHFNDKLEMEKKVDYNWGSLIRDIGNAGKIEEFASWLVARDQVGQYERLKKLKSWRSTLEDETEIKQVDEKIKNVMGYLKANEKILPKQLVEQVHNQYKNNNKFKEWAEKFDTLLSYDVEFQKNVGILSEEHYKAIKNSYGYAPMRRELEDMILGDQEAHKTLSGYKVGKMTQIKGREGGTHNVVNPLLSAIKNHEEAIKKGYKQMVANKLYDTMKYFPKFAQEIELEVTTNETTGQKYYKTMEGKDPTMDNNIIVKMVNGEQKAIVVNPEIIKIIKTVTQGVEKGAIEKFLVGASRVFSKGTTGTYLPFFMTNLFRDQQQAIVHTRNGYKPVASQMKLLKYLYAKNTPEAKYMQEYLALENNYGSYNFSEETGENVLKYITEGDKWYKRWAGNVEKLTNATSMPAQASETITRMAEYVESRMNGKSMWQALEEAGQLTAPFHHKGMLTRNAFGRGAMGSVPFLNSILQGLAQYMRTARGPIGRRRIAAMLGANTALVFSVMTYALLTADEDERRALFDKNPEEFAKFIFLPGDVKIPIPQELGFIGATFGMMMYDINGAGYNTGDYVDVVGSWLPDQAKVWDAPKMALSWLPQLFKPSIEVIMNVQTFPSVRPLENEWTQKKDSQFRYNRGSSEVAKWLGNTELAKNLGSDGLSPIEIDHLRKGYLGRASGYWAGDGTSINPFSGLQDKRFFTSGRTVEKFKNEKKAVERLNYKPNQELLGMTDEQKIEAKAKMKALEAIDEKIGKLSNVESGSMEEKELENEIYTDIDNYFRNGVEVTELDKMRYEKKQEQEEKKSRREEIMAGAMERYKNGSEQFGKLTEIQNWAKGEFGEDKKGYEQWKKDFFMEYSYKDNERMMEAYNARNNDEKIYLLKKMQNEAGKENFKEELRVLKRNKIFSDAVIKAVSEG